MKKENVYTEKLKKIAIENIKRRQLEQFRDSMPEGKKGYEFTFNGKTYVAAVRRLTPEECDLLQGVPSWYDWSGVSENQHYKMDGNGWQIDTIMHCWKFLPKFDRPIRVWSLFDGMSCASIALRQLNIPVEVFISSEVDKHAIHVERNNFPDMIQVGSVTDINVTELVDKFGIPDFLVGGSPCQSFSFSGRMNGMTTNQGEEIYTLERYLQLKQGGFEFDGQSYLFWEFMRILTELRAFNSNILFFLENVEMLEKWERVLSHAVGIRGVHINSALVCAQQRRRIYWSNIRTQTLQEQSLFTDYDADDPFAWPMIATDIPQPDDRGITIRDILQEAADSRYYLTSERVGELIRKTDMKKLEPYLMEPQYTEEELQDEISRMVNGDEEKDSIHAG
ncbi:MAG: DNA cytosine methyltransferase [Bacteroides sp.]